VGELTRQSTEDLVPVASLQEYFRDSVDSAMAANNVTVDHHTAYYVVNLLTVFARSEHFYDATEEGPALRPLALMWADAIEAPTCKERNHALRRVGDVSLFLSGFFSEGIHYSAVDIGYYVNMGGSAYQSLSSSVGRGVQGVAFSDVFAELGAKFGQLVDVLNEVREAAAGDSDQNALRLYEIWSKTGSQRAARMLKSLGIVPIKGAFQGSEH